MQLLHVFVILNAIVFLSSCTSHRHSAPVVEKGVAEEGRIQHHVVSVGETLYQIAMRYDLDYRQLANRNGISPPYVIFPGQILYLDVENAPVRKKSPVIAKARPSKQAPDTTKTPKESSVTRSKTPTKPSVAMKKNPTPSVASGNLRWQWPLKGRVLERFSSDGVKNKGIDIAGQLGESVSAAESGVVVYAGRGLRGYGNLLIIKHNEEFLSAYAHNSKLLVVEQQLVKRGQKIAEVGATGTDRVKLHFEIRKDGKPVDPQQYLPK